MDELKENLVLIPFFQDVDREEKEVENQGLQIERCNVLELPVVLIN